MPVCVAGREPIAQRVLGVLPRPLFAVSLLLSEGQTAAPAGVRDGYQHPEDRVSQRARRTGDSGSQDPLEDVVELATVTVRDEVVVEPIDPDEEVAPGARVDGNR